MSVAKRLVSKQKKRYTEDGFNLDLSYITPRIIAMGFPAENFEGVYRNHIDDVQKFFKLKHDGHYLIYNLCSERQSNESKLENKVVRFPFDDHNAPPFYLIYMFCLHAKDYLELDHKNTIAVHCKAGKGRTGVMICCLLMFMKLEKDADSSLKFYAKMRTHNEKGVTIPSQRRYIHYFCQFLKLFENSENIFKNYILRSVHIDTLLFDGLVHNSDVVEVKVKVYSENICVYKSPWFVPRTVRNSMLSYINITPVIISGDIMFEVFAKKKQNIFMTNLIGKFWLNTFFMTREHNELFNKLSAEKDENDSVIKDIKMNVIADDDEYDWIILQKQNIDKLNKDYLDKEVSASFKIIIGVRNIGLQSQTGKLNTSSSDFDVSKKKKKKTGSIFSNLFSFFDKNNSAGTRLSNSAFLPSKKKATYFSNFKLTYSNRNLHKESQFLESVEPEHEERKLKINKFKSTFMINKITEPKTKLVKEAIKINEVCDKNGNNKDNAFAFESINISILSCEDVTDRKEVYLCTQHGFTEINEEVGHVSTQWDHLELEVPKNNNEKSMELDANLDNRVEQIVENLNIVYIESCSRSPIAVRKME